MRWWNLQQLKSKDARTRQPAVERLAAGEPGEAVADLKLALHDRDASVRAAVMRALGAFDHDRRQAVAAETPGRLGDQTAGPPLVTAMRDEHPWVNRSAARSLWQLQWPPTAADERTMPERLLRN